MNYGAVENRKFGIYPIAIGVRKKLADTYIYRLMAGNGYYGTIRGAKYQQRMTYFVPDSTNNPEGEPMRAMLRAAVDYWKNVLTDDQKTIYNEKAVHIGGLSGYNLFIKDALKGVYHMFVDRGDPAAYDFAKTDLTTDDAWHDLNLSLIVPKTARAVLLMGMLEGAGVDWAITFRENGNTNEVNHEQFETLRAGVLRHRTGIVIIGSDQIIEYKASDQAWTTLDLIVRGWWT